MHSGLVRGLFVGVLAMAHTVRGRDLAAAFSAQEYESGAVMEQLMQEKMVSIKGGRATSRGKNVLVTNHPASGTMERNGGTRHVQSSQISSHQPIRTM
jgi:hypothetical protein